VRGDALRSCSHLFADRNQLQICRHIPSAKVIFFVSFFFKKKEMGCGATPCGLAPFILQTEYNCKFAVTFRLQKLSSLFLSSLRRKKWGAGQRPAVFPQSCS
jgi:hypothetical protein